MHLQGPAPQQLEHDGVGHIVAALGRCHRAVRILQPRRHARMAGDRHGQALHARLPQGPRLADQPRPPPRSPRPRRPTFKDIDLAVLTATIATYQKLGNWTPHVEITKPGVRGDARYLPARRPDHQAPRLRGRGRAAAGVGASGAGGAAELRRRRSIGAIRLGYAPYNVDEKMKETIGWIGVGSMGHRMSRHLVDGGLSAGGRRRGEHGAGAAAAPTIAKSNAEVAEQADTIILSLPDGKVARRLRARWRRPRSAQGQDGDRHLDHRHQGRRGRRRHCCARPASSSSTRRCRAARRAPTRRRSPSCWPARPRATSASSR